MEKIISSTDSAIFQTYGRYPVALTEGRGVRVRDAAGREYLDFLAGIAVCNLGHCHPAVVAAAREQLGRLMHVSNFFYTRPQAALAEQLVAHSFAERVFFCNSGAEANEAAIKLARRYAYEQSEGTRYEIITMCDSFHGRTMATLSATGQQKLHAGFAPLLPGFRYVPFNDIAALEAAITDATCAIMLEPIQGEGGVNMPRDGYLPAVRALCDRHGLVLIFDEVQVGMGRTGRLFAYEHYGVAPDVMTLAKALGGGLPAGAMLAGGKVVAGFSAGSHASTFGGNPVAMAAGLAVMRELLEGGVLDNCRRVSSYFFERLRALQAEFPALITEVRGRGLIVGVQLACPGGPIVQQCLERGLIMNCTMGTVLRFLPPLTITPADVDAALAILAEVLAEVRH